MRTARLVIGVVWGLLGPAHVHAGDRAPLMAAIRPSVRGSFTERERQAFRNLPGYELDLTLHDDLSAYALRETIELTNTTAQPLNEVVLRIFGNSGPAAPAVRFETGSCSEQPCVITQPRPSVLRLQLTAALPAGAKLTIQLQLSGQLRVIDAQQTDLLSQGLSSLSQLLTGEQTSDYGLLSLGDGIASFAHFYAVVAERDGRGWVTQDGKPFGDLGARGLSFVSATLRAPRDVMIASSGVIAEQRAASGSGLQTYKVKAPLVRDFAFSASRGWLQRTRQVGDVSVRASYLARDAEAGARVLDTAAGALAVFERRFGPYPYPELDVVEAVLAGGAGGCEFSGLVTVASMLYQPLTLDPSLLAAVSGGAAGSPLEFTTAHEVAHQYWYGLVGSDARAHPFQDESLTQWSARLYFEDRFGAARGRREAEAQIALNYRVMRMLGHADAAVDRPVDAFDSSLSYGGLVYGKGAYLYSALRELVGDRAFFEALRGYAQQYRFGEAPATALFDRLSESTGRVGQVRGLVQHWLFERHGDHDLGGGLKGPFGGLTSHTDAPPANDGKPAPRQNGVDMQQLQSALQGMLGSQAGGDVDLEQLKGLLGSQGSVTDLLNQLSPGAERHDAEHQEMPRELRELTDPEQQHRGL